MTFLIECMNLEFLETPRMKLRILTPDVYDCVFNHYSDQEIMHFFGLENEQLIQEEKRKYNLGIATYNKTFVNFQLIDKLTETLIGACGFHTYYIEHSRAEIGYHLFFDHYKNRGLMTEALLKIIHYGFDVMKLNRIEAFVSPHNEASIKLLKKFNFVDEGLMRKHYCKNNIMEDSLVCSLLRSEYGLQ